MKNNIINLLLGIFIFPLCLLSSCNDDDELNSDSLVVYVKNTTMDTDYFESYICTPNNTIGKSSLEIAPILSTRRLLVDAEISYVVDESLIERYNTEKQKDYKLLSSELYKLKNNGKIIIKKGEFQSKDLLGVDLKMEDIASVLDKENGNYLLPLKLSSISAKDKGIQLSGNFNVLYLVLNFEHSNIDISSPLEGTVIDRSQWELTVSGFADADYEPINAIDGNITTSWAYMPQNGFLSIDMSKTETIKGFHIISNEKIWGWFNAYPSVVDVEVSTDNTTWQKQGKARFLITDSGVDQKVKFYNPVVARYLRFIFVENKDYTSVAEINILK